MLLFAVPTAISLRMWDKYKISNPKSPVAICKNLKNAEEESRLQKIRSVEFVYSKEKDADLVVHVLKDDQTINEEGLSEDVSSHLIDLIDPDSLNSKDTKDFVTAILALDRAIHHASKDPGAQNVEITKKLRAALNCRAYQAMKADPECQAVKYLHRLAYAMHTSGGSATSQVTLADNLLSYGAKPEKALEAPEAPAPEGQVSQASPNPFGQNVVRQFEQANKVGRKNLDLADGGPIASVAYALKHPGQIRGVVAGLGGWKRKLMGQKYDPHLLSNNSSLQGTTRITVGQGESSTSTTSEVENIYGPSPTVGNDIAPEFLALCQGAENNLSWALKQEDKTPDPTLPTKIVFINLQKWDRSAGEGTRSAAAMRLNETFPNVCKMITLSMDSELYRMKDAKKDMPSINWPGAEKFGVDLLNKLLDGVDSQRTREPGCYFPPSFDKELLTKAIDQATKKFGQYTACKGPEAYKLLGAYQEYVYQLIQRQMEIDAVKELHALGLKEGKVIVKASCKEHADRGGMHGMALAYLRSGGGGGEDNAENIKQIVGAGLYRALVAKKRMVQEERIDHPLAMMELISPREFERDVRVMNAGEGVQLAPFVPAFGPRKVIGATYEIGAPPMREDINEISPITPTTTRGYKSIKAKVAQYRESVEQKKQAEQAQAQVYLEALKNVKSPLEMREQHNDANLIALGMPESSRVYELPDGMKKNISKAIIKHLGPIEEADPELYQAARNARINMFFIQIAQLGQAIAVSNNAENPESPVKQNKNIAKKLKQILESDVFKIMQEKGGWQKEDCKPVFDYLQGLQEILHENVPDKDEPEEYVSDRGSPAMIL